MRLLCGTWSLHARRTIHYNITVMHFTLSIYPSTDPSHLMMLCNNTYEMFVVSDNGIGPRSRAPARTLHVHANTPNALFMLPR